ncbi:ATPase family AAA domain-containing protein 5 [Trametes pubescens]|uniref:ATPase family AAA domain-containing protein 5 n=1 Tax=Trametes pubescens TaxID=154538 RepID=A0A1M2VHU1_TRAPU|nr:ATPase family AAA domain-containing protein 5 [Trametes pubescens]
MSQSTKRKRTRKPKKEKDSLSRQTSLWDAFGIKSSSKKNTPQASATTSENEAGPPDDVIDICSSDAEPVPEDSSLPPASSSPCPAESSSSNEKEERTSDGSKDVPIIIIDSSPLRSHARPRKLLPQHPPKPLYSIFAPRKRPDDRSSSQTPAPRGSTVSIAPFPDFSTQHVRGPQSVFHSSSSQTLPRILRDGPAEPQGSFDYSCLTRGRDQDAALASSAPPSNHSHSLDAATRERYYADIPEAHKSYPALNRLFAEPSHSAKEATDELTSSNFLWNDKWRPRRADQVLGNERSALYLRDWLLALKLHIARSDDKGKRKGKGTKRRRIIREVQRKRRRVGSEDPEEPWLAEDSTDDELPLEVAWESEDDPFPSKLSRLKRAETDEVMGDPPTSPSTLPQTVTDDPPSQRPNTIPAFSYKPPRIGNEVHSTILLSGPSGCGKTAAVYACAEELGWDVFEVYPGVGERSGAALNKLIGDVGKNHLVTQNRQQVTPEPDAREKKPLRPKTNFFAKRVASDDEVAVMPSHDPSSLPEVEQPKPQAEMMSVVSQSIVLVEEVDVLYKEDAGFWSALLKIIKECRRPIVLTCNDTSLVPFQDLPLQTTLNFTPCPPPLAVSYLQTMCLAEGRLLDCAMIERLYEYPDTPTEEHCIDSALHPDHILRPTQDLRKTINQLQLGDSSRIDSGSPVSSGTAQEDQSVERLVRIARCIELSSFVDSQLRRPAEELLRDHLSNNTSPSADDLLGYHHLIASPADMESHLPVTFSTYQWDEVIVDDLLSFAQTDHPAPAELRDRALHLHALNTPHCGALCPVLDSLKIPRELLVRDASAIFMDYEPWTRHMTRIDDARAAASLALMGQREGTRRTRNSQRLQAEEVRWVLAGDAELEVLRRTGFDVDDASGIPVV